jgi:hypothetical protein
MVDDPRDWRTALFRRSPEISVGSTSLRRPAGSPITLGATSTLAPTFRSIHPERHLIGDCRDNQRNFS